MDSAESASAGDDLPFTGSEMLRYFSELDSILVSTGASTMVHLYVGGGAVIAVKTDARLTTDVDVVSEGMTEQLRQCVAEVSRRHRGLRPDWLNDGAKLHRVSLPMAPERLYTGERLLIDSAGDQYVLVMKLASGRQIDEADCEILIRTIGIRTESELFDLIEQGVPADLRTPAMVYFAAERLAAAYTGTSRRHHPRGASS